MELVLLYIVVRYLYEFESQFGFAIQTTCGEYLTKNGYKISCTTRVEDSILQFIPLGKSLGVAMILPEMILSFQF